MKEVEFRVFDKERKTMLYHNDNIRIGFWLDGEINIATSSFQFNDYFINQDKNNWIVTQYTGLKDKNGKKIYEGDIVKGISNNLFSMRNIKQYEIIWGIDKWHVKGTYFSLQELINYCNGNISIIGNIYENTELLEIK